MPRTTQHRVSELRALDAHAPASLAKLRSALQSTSGGLVAAAARIVEEQRLEALVPELGPAFERLCEQPAKRDPGCRGKLAIARALHALDHWDDRVLVGGLSCVQREGWGAEDTAAELRGVCGLAHAHAGRSDALDVLAGLLADPERTTRMAAAQGIGDTGRADASGLLRFKLLIGDDEPQVLSACVEALLALAREASYGFLVRLLQEHDPRAEVAALSLGSARFPEALDVLTAWCLGCSPEQRHRVAYLAIALLRSPGANSYLLDAIRSHGRTDAVAAARALATFRDDASVVEQIRIAGRDQPDPAARREITELLA